VEALSSSPLLLALLSPDGPPTLWVAEGRVKDASAAARKLFGSGLMPGMAMVSLFDEDSRQKLEVALGGNQPRALEVQLPVQGAPPTPARFLVVPDGDEAVLVWLGGSREAASGGLYDHLRTLLSANDQLTNLTRELSVRTRELSVSRQRLEMLNQLREEDAATLSHDIKSPLNAIALQARGLERQADTVKPEIIRERAGAIRRTVRVLLGLVTNVLDGVKLDAGTLDLVLEPVSLAEVARQVVEALNPVAEHLGMRLELKEGAGAELVLQADRTRLFQSITNLAENALRYSPKGEVVTLSIFRQGDRMCCTVRDRGPGVPAEERERIFERLYQGGRRKGAAGLGLAIARQLVEMHKGKLFVEEGPGGGACFVIELPLN